MFGDMMGKGGGVGLWSLHNTGGLPEGLYIAVAIHEGYVGKGE